MVVILTVASEDFFAEQQSSVNLTFLLDLTDVHVMTRRIGMVGRLDFSPRKIFCNISSERQKKQLGATPKTAGAQLASAFVMAVKSVSLNDRIRAAGESQKGTASADARRWSVSWEKRPQREQSQVAGWWQTDVEQKAALVERSPKKVASGPVVSSEEMDEELVLSSKL